MTAWDAERWHAATGELDVLLGRTPASGRRPSTRCGPAIRGLADDVARLLRDHEAAQAGGFLEQGPDALLTTDGDAGRRMPARRPRSAAALPAGTDVRRLPGAPGARPRRHGPRLRSRGDRERPARRAEGARAALRRRARAGALRARRPPRRVDRSRALRVRLRRRRDRRRAGHRHGADAGHAGGSPRRRGAAAAGRRRRHRAAARGRPAGRRRGRHPPPRRQAVELLRRRRRRGEDRRLRHLAIAAPGRGDGALDRATSWRRRRPTPRPSSCAAPRSTPAPTSTASARRSTSWSPAAGRSPRRT